ncbi:MAG: hypothetical protein R8N23_07480 [Reichenbachiella sp.]|uniref:hypothetical protein n=1 Tax=Reichenbachiella sp. TaxID=2184521 RepID=UPI00296752A5|nr:hypothetical protein [Reichenbachiella sp.]MDW3209690.1 hypothetical protein [Reichenbachiella sp.]
MKFIFTIIAFVSLQLSLFAQEWKAGIINDPDGYTNIRSGKGSGFEVIDKLLTNELFFYVDSIGENWLAIKITKCNCDTPYNIYNQITGFVHRSRIQELDKLGQADRMNFFYELLAKEDLLTNNMSKVQDRTTKEFEWNSAESNVFHDYQYVASLNSLIKYLCEFKDGDLADKFLKRGSEDESPMFAMGELFVCQPEWAFEQFSNRKYLMDQLIWGFVNVIYNKPQEEAMALKKKFNDLRLANGMEAVDFKLYEE